MDTTISSLNKKTSQKTVFEDVPADFNESPKQSLSDELSSDFESPVKIRSKNNKILTEKNQSNSSDTVSKNNEADTEPDDTLLKTNQVVSAAELVTKKHLCKFCNAPFASWASLSRHRSHSCKENLMKKDTLLKCSDCGRQYSRSDKYRAHTKKCNQGSSAASNMSGGIRKTLCPIPECSHTFLFKSSVYHHLIQFHKRSDLKDSSIHSFKTFDEFVKWKTSIEDKSFSYYSQQYGRKGGRLYFYCQKDGKNRCHGEERKTPRRNSKGSVKGDNLCLSMMAVKESDSNVSVRFYPSHSHKCLARDLKYQPLSSETNDFIRRQLAWNVPPRKIVENLRDDSYKRENRWQKQALKRDNIVKIKTIAERKRKSKVKQRYAEDDATSVYMKTQVLLKERFNPILIYKPQGGKLVHGPAGAENLPPEIFLFGFQTSEQMKMLEKHSKVILVMDETHSTNQCGFKLLNLVVRDEFNLGYPVGHLITSRSDEVTLKFFFQAIKDRCPDLSINCCITDDDPALINSLEAGVGEKIWHILCIWHIHRTVQCNLREHIKDSKLVEEMYQVICLIIDSKTEEDFEKLKEAFLQDFGHVSKTYKKYFMTKFLPKSQKWAMCFRKDFHGGVDTTMLCESFHNILKSVYLKRVPNRRVDDLIDLLLQIEEDYFVRHDNAIQLETLWPRDVKKIKERHERGKGILDEDVSKVSSMCYLVKSQEKNTEEEYKVVRCIDKCDASPCLYNCPSCIMCSHLYQCTCPDTTPLCKHIHKVHLMHFISSEVSAEPQVQQEPEFFAGDSLEETCLDSTDKVAQNTKLTIEKRIHKIKDIMKEVEDQLDYSPVKKFMLSRIQNVLGDLHNQCRALSDCKIRENQVPEMEPQINFCPNEKLEVQVKVKSFKKVTKAKKKGLQRPNKKSAEEIRKFLFSEDVLNANSKNIDVCPGTSDECLESNIVHNNLQEHNDESTINKFFSILSDKEDTLFSFTTSGAQNLLEGNLSDEFAKSLHSNSAILIPLKHNSEWIVAAIRITTQELWYFNPMSKKKECGLSPYERKFLSSLASFGRKILPEAKWNIQRHFDFQEDSANIAVLICWFGYNISDTGKGPIPHLPDVNACRKEIYDAIGT